VLHTEAEVKAPGGELHVMATGTYQPIRSNSQDPDGVDEAAFGRVQHYFDHGQENHDRRDHQPGPDRPHIATE